MSITFTKSFTLTSAILSAAMLIASVNNASAATAHNPNISISKADLKAKCSRSGGDWDVEKNGVYRCVVHGDDSMTVVECEDGECDGYIFDNERKTRLSNRFRTPQVIAPSNLMEPIIAPNNSPKPSIFQQQLSD